MRTELWDSLPEPADPRWSEWAELARAARNVFGTPEFATTWWGHFGRGEPLLVASRTDDGTLVALWPLYRRRLGPLRVIRSIGHGCGDELSLVCAAPRRAEAVIALGQVLGSGRPGGDVVILDHVPIGRDELRAAECEPDPARAAPGWDRIDHRTLLVEECPLLLAPGVGWEELLTARSRNFRQQVRRRERRLRRDHDVALRLTREPDELATDLTELFLLHRRRFDGRASNTFTAPRQLFHRDWARVCLSRGWLRLWTLGLDGLTVAAWYGFRFADVESFYQSGRDPDWDSASVGFALLAHTVRAALEDGLGEYRFLRGDEPYKSRFANQADAVATVAIPRTALGSAAIGIGRRARAWF